MLTSWDDDHHRNRDRDRDRWRSDQFTTSTSTSTSTSTAISTTTSTPTNTSTWQDHNYYHEQPPSPFASTHMRNDIRDHSSIPSSQSMSSSYQHQHQHQHSTSFTSSMTYTHTTPSISQYSIPTTATSTSISISSQSPSYPTSTFLPSTSTSTSTTSQSFPTSSFPSTSTFPPSTSTSSQSQSFPSFPSSTSTSSFSSTSSFPSSTFISSPPTTTHHLSQDLGQLLDLLSSTTTSTSTWTPSTTTTSSHIQPHVTSHIQQQPSRSQHLSSTYTSPLPMSHTPSLPSLSPLSSSSTSTSPMPVTDGEPSSKKRRSSTSTSTSTKSKPTIPDDVPDSLARRLKHRAIDANRRVRLSAGFDALQAMVAPGESHSQIVLLEKSGEMLRSMQAEAAALKTTLRMLKRRRARRERGLSVKEEDEDDDEEISMVKKESMGRVVSDRPSAQFNVAHLNYFCDSNVMLSCTNLSGVLVDVNAALLRAFHLRAPEDRVGKFTLAPHTIKLATSSQPFGQHLAGLPLSYQSQKTLYGPNPPIDPSATDPRTLSGLPSSNIVMRDGSVSAQPGLIKGATTNELIPYLPSVVSLQKLLRGEIETCSIIFEGIDGRGQRYHARFILWCIYNNNNHTPQYIMAMCNPNSIIHFPQDSPPYYSTALRSTQGSSISIASSSSSSSSENSPVANDFHS